MLLVSPTFWLITLSVPPFEQADMVEAMAIAITSTNIRTRRERVVMGNSNGSCAVALGVAVNGRTTREEKQHKVGGGSLHHSPYLYYWGSQIIGSQNFDTFIAKYTQNVDYPIRTAYNGKQAGRCQDSNLTVDLKSMSWCKRMTATIHIRRSL